jgi:hypothetical protein
MDLPEVAGAASSCQLVIRISMTMPFASTVVVNRRVIELFFIIIGPQPTGSSSLSRHPAKRKFAPWRENLAAYAALYLRSILMTRL